MIVATLSTEPSGTTFSGAMDHVAQGFEVLGAVILVAGVAWSFVLAVVAWRRSGQPTRAYLALRQAFGGTLLLGLEVLVAADLIRTVAVAPTLDNVLQEGLSLIAGPFPWRMPLPQLPAADPSVTANICARADTGEPFCPSALMRV